MLAAVAKAPELPWTLKLLALACIVGFYALLAWVNRRP
jgi:hypothetical protein